MATSKPKIQGYVERSLFEQFEAERQQWGLTQSQALERVFAERYRQDQANHQSINQYEGQKEITNLWQEINANQNEFRFRLWLLESKLGLKHNPDYGDTPEITSSSPEITNDTPEITSSSPEITSDTPEITSSSPEITNDTPEITSSSPEITSNSYKLFVICLFNTLPPADPEDFRYWSGSPKSQFSLSLDRAVKYKSLKNAGKQLDKLIASGEYSPDAGWQIKMNTLEFFERKKHQRKAKLAAS